MAFNQIDPIGEWRADARAAQISNILAQCFGDKDSTLDKHMLRFGSEERRASQEELKQKAQMITMIMREITEAREAREKKRNG